MLSFPFHIPRPNPLSKIGGNAFGAHFLQLYRKNEYSDPPFLFHDFNKNSASFQWKKNWHKSMFSFLVNLPNCTGWAITGRIVCVQFQSTLERKLKTRAFKGSFLVRRWINNTFKSNSVWYHMHHQKNLFLLSSFGLRGFCQMFLNSLICQYCDVKTSTVTPTFHIFFITFLTCYISVPSFIYNLC